MSWIALAAWLGAREAGAQEIERPRERVYAEQGTREVGGDVAVSWTREAFQFDFGPSIGLFVSDNLELSALFRLSHLRTVEGGSTAGSVLLEPSWHVPISADESVYLFGGTGFGLGYDGVLANFEVVPRLGVNTRIGRSGILTPAIRMPILFRSRGPALVGLAFEIGVGTVF